ncbi:MAG TPA: phospholipase D-like domain-containing protein [Thermoanaerobaculia bacterium]|jgi:cardiolipin synthase|nr:phospholipase D-like domain-containing protein [Thermoanaerobaculia bacterium]
MAVLHFGVAIVASAHVILYKRDVRAAIGWTGLVWLAPFAGSLLYWLLGINRIRRRAVRLEHPALVVRESTRVYAAGAAGSSGEARLEPLVELTARVTGNPLLSGNRVTALDGGDVAYPAMLDAIASARRSILFATYIFDHDRAGKLFLDALAAAQARGVAVRVLIDGVGARYSRPRMTRALRRRGVGVAEFLATTLPIPNPYFNLRNHRKILVVDGRRAFTGGMNIREGCLLRLEPPPRSPVRDLHFEITGPVVAQIFEAGAFDWHFATGESLDGPAWAIDAEPTGEVEARVIAFGPDENLETLGVVLHGALATARSRVCVVTPYFLPDRVLIAALRLAALRGVRVDVVLPERSNLRFVQWAATAQLRQVLDDDCWVWLSPPPFDHTKIVVVDGEWSLVGSANWDARSLRLNFELDVECYDRPLAQELEAMVEERISTCRRLRHADLEARPLAIQLRDGVARLFTPYL